MKMRMLLVLVIFLLAGCCSLADITEANESMAPPEFPASFCTRLSNEEIRDVCMNNAPLLDDEQRIRDYYTHSDTIMSDREELSDYTASLTSLADEWNSATYYQGREGIYNSYKRYALLYANKLEETIDHMDDWETFLNGNKAYLVSQGFDAQEDISTLTSLKADLKADVVSIQDTLRIMTVTLDFEREEREELNALRDTLERLAVALG